MTNEAAFEKVRYTNAVVRRILDAGGTVEDCVIGLDEYASLLMEHLRKLENIRPRKIRTSKGVFVWHCPDELIPEDEPTST